jgi:hypothetical protein
VIKLYRWLLPILLAAILPAQDPAILQVRVVEGDGAVYAIGSRATRGITVQVTDESSKPVEGASVSFRLPESGPSGTFSTGSKTEIVTTQADGRASAWGMQWNRSAGSFEVRVTVVKGQTRAGTVCPQVLSESGAAAAGERIGPRRGHKWLWVALGVVGGVAGGLATTGLLGKPAAAANSTPGLTIGAPTIILGHP